MSGAPLEAPAGAPQAAHERVHGHPIVLNGRTTNLVIANHSGIATVTGSGHLTGFGRVTISSTVISQSERSLLVTPWLLYANAVITSPEGHVDVRIIPGTIGLNPFAQPVHLEYSVQGGTGAFRNATGKGLVDLSLFQPIPETLDQLKQMGNQLDTQGIRFTLHFHPGRLNQFGNFASMWYKVIQTVAQASAGHPSHTGGEKAK
jgi:hypothetical protein